MKKLITILVFLLFTGLPVFAGSVLKLAAPPSLWVQQKGDTVSGPVIDVLQKVVETEGVVLKSEILPWARAISHIESGLIDVIPVIFKTREREEFMVFSSPYLKVPAVIAVAAGKSFPFKGLEDLKGIKGVMVKGDSVSDEFQQYQSHLTLTKVSRYEHALKMLVSNRADYAVVAKYGFMVEIERLGYTGEIEFLPEPVATRDLHFAFSKKSKHLDLLPKLNERIIKIQQDGSLDQLVGDAINTAARK